MSSQEIEINKNNNKANNSEMIRLSLYEGKKIIHKKMKTNQKNKFEWG